METSGKSGLGPWPGHLWGVLTNNLISCGCVCSGLKSMLENPN